MTVLVTGSTGNVGSEVVRQLVAEGVEVRALTRSPDDAQLPDGATAVGGELSDPSAMRAALTGVSGLFLLSAVTPDELTGTLIALSLAREAGVRDLVYLSVIHADLYTDPPHSAAKAAAERCIHDLGPSATILRPGYYMQNDLNEKDRLLDGVYAPPVGNRGVLAADIRDIAEVATKALLRRMAASAPEPTRTLDVAAPETLTGDGIAAVWSRALDVPIRYGGDDLDDFEQQLAAAVPGFVAHDMRLMMRRYQTDGVLAAPGTDVALRELLGRPMRTYRDFVAEAAAEWRH